MIDWALDPSVHEEERVIDPDLASLVAACLDDQSMRRYFGSMPVARALQEGLTRRVGDLDVFSDGPDDLTAQTAVQGHARRPYVTRVELTVHEDAPPDLWSVCSCPVGDACKHAAAVCLVLRALATPAIPVWEQTLGGLLAQLDRSAPAPALGAVSTVGVRELALRFELRTPRRGRYAAPPPALLVRPVQRGAKGTWIKTGLSWREIPAALTRAEHEPAQLRALVALQAALVTTLGWGGHSDAAELDDFGPAVWALLRTALEAGVAVDLAGTLRSVVVAEQPLRAALDLASAAADGATRLTVGVQHADRVWSGGEVLLVGRPAHGVVLLDRVGVRSDIVVGPLEAPLPEALAALLVAPAPLEVPAEHRDRLAADFLPRLVRRLPTGSRDGSVSIPRPVPPRLVVGVSWGEGAVAELSWEWRYDPERSGGEVRTWPVTSRADLDTVRDRAAELALLRALAPLTESSPIASIAGSPETPQLVRGEAALALPDVLDRLAAGDLVEVEESDRPDFREATGDLEVSFEVATGPSADGDTPTDWLDLEVVVRIEGRQIPLPVILASLTAGLDRIVLPDGLHLATDRPELTALRELVAAAAQLGEVDPGDRRLRVGGHDLGLWDQLAELGVVDAQAQAWVERARRLQGRIDLPAVEPAGVVSTLRDYQLHGFRWLAYLWDVGLGGILADDMGLGKTLQVLALVSHARARGAAPFLVVAPTSVVSAWVEQAAVHTPGLRVAAVTSTQSRREHSIAELAAGADIVVTTYTLVRLEGAAYADLTWDGVVLDEAQQVKNHQGKTYQAVRLVDAPFRLAVTGTPFENRLLELWSLLSITCPGLYPWPQKFTEHVARPVERHGDQLALERFRRRIAPFVLRRTKELVAADLPPKQEQVLEVRLGAKHRKVYDTHLQKERQRILGLVEDFERNRVAIFSSLTKLRQLALDAALVDPAYDALGSAKIDLLLEQLAEVTAEGHRALVFSQFTSFLGRVRDRLTAAGIECAYLDGSTTRRGEVVEGFRSGAAPVFLISLKAGGVGLTLTEADYVYVLDPWWNPATEAQAVDRAHRIGQQRPVLVYRLVSADTIEDKVMALKARKAALFAQVVDGEGAAGVGIDAEDIRALLAP